jgi:transcriptional regulator with XRE-family HTH domain
MARSYRTHISAGRPAKSRLTPKHMTKEEFARRLYGLMIEKGWRQADLARAAGLPRNAISVYLRGASLPNPDSLKKLAKALDVEPDILLPNYKESAIDRDNPALEFRVSPGDPKTAWLRINRSVSTSLAIKIMGLLEEEDAQTANGK